MPDVRFGGPLGTLVVNGKPTQMRGFGSLEVSQDDPAIATRATQALTELLARPGFDITKALLDTRGLQAELEAKLAGARVTQLMLTVPA